MKLRLDEIKNITLGIDHINKTDNGFEFFKMNDKLASIITSHSEDYEKKTIANSSIRLDFYTNSKYIKFDYKAIRSGSSRDFYFINVLINGKEVACVGEKPVINKKGSFSYSLDGLENRITIFLPNLYVVSLSNIELDDNAYIRPFICKRKILGIGDSLMQGYDAMHSQNSFMNQVGLLTDSEIINLGIAAACFEKDFIDDYKYNEDLILVNFGTNDWYWREKEDLLKHAKDFFDKLIEIHHTTPIYYILPIRRYDCIDNRPSGNFYDCRMLIKEAIKDYQITIIDNLDLVNDDSSLYSDNLHPMDEGHKEYARNLIKHIKELK